MKKVLLPLLILAAFSCLIAVESAPSAIVGYVKYPCVAPLDRGSGLNFIALPMDSGWTTVGQLGDAYPGMMDAMSYWDAASQTWVACYWDGYWADEFDVYPGMPVMINALGAFDLYSMGGLPSSRASVDLLFGLNAVMVPLSRSDLSTSGLVGDDMGGDAYVDALSFWDAPSQTWVACYWDGYWADEFGTWIGMPLMVNAVQDFTWAGRSKSVQNLKASRASK